MSEMKLDARELQLKELFDEQRKKISALEDKLANADYQLEGRDNEIMELENQQKIDALQIVALQNEKGELTDRVKELEAQIEKMKCGQNCNHSYLYQEDRKCEFTYCDCINCKDKWELRR